MAYTKEQLIDWIESEISIRGKPLPGYYSDEHQAELDQAKNDAKLDLLEEFLSIVKDLA